MRDEAKILIVLLFLSPALGELLSGSSPPLVFFNPFTLLLLVLLYGCGTVLIREARVRWGLQWSVIFLAVAYGIVEEGLMVKSFFNAGWVDMGVLSGYGMYFGVQWVWTIMLIFYHATVSTLIPITMVDLLWPKYKNTPLLGKRGLLLALAGITGVTLFGMVFMGSSEGGEMIPYHPHPGLLIGSFMAVMLLIGSAYALRKNRVAQMLPILPPFMFGVLGFVFMAFNLIVPNALAESQVPAVITLLVQFAVTTMVLLFVFYQICHQSITKRHMVSLISGSLLFWILLTPVYELGGAGNPDPTQGMAAVGLVSLFLLLIWRHVVLKGERYEKHHIFG